MTAVNRFKAARTKHNQNGQQTIKEVASATGITKSLIDDLESSVGKPRNVGYLTVKKLAEYYGVSSDYLLGITDSEKPNLSISECTGLTENSIDAIRRLDRKALDGLNALLENIANK